MALKRYKTDLRLWLWILLVLFVVPWFFPVFRWPYLCDEAPATLLIHLFTDINSTKEVIYSIGIYSLAFGLPAISIGWVLQCVVVMIKHTEMQDNAPADSE